jgi:cytolysin-activating lysine-acyltransferase
MNKAEAAKYVDEPLLGEAALKEALAGFGVLADAKRVLPATHISPGNGSCGRGPSLELTPKTVSQVLGEIVWLMTQSPRHKPIPLGDLEWLMMPAILLKQFRIFYKGEQPVGIAVWALVDDFVAKRFDAGDERLSAIEWKSGTNMRILDVVAPFGAEAEMRVQTAEHALISYTA